MKPSVLILTGIFALALFACTQPTVPPRAGGVAAFRLQAGVVCPLSTFLSKVHYLAQTPAFRLPDSGFRNAPPIDSTPVNANITQDLTDAFNIAPDFFKNQLCNLTGIYVDRTGCTSYDPSSCSGPDPSDRLWGFRAFDGSGSSAGEFIGTWLGLWQNGVQGHAPVLSSFETGRLQNLLNWTPNNSSIYPIHDSADPDTVAMTVLAALAHGVGHI